MAELRMRDAIFASRRLCWARAANLIWPLLLAAAVALDPDTIDLSWQHTAAAQSQPIAIPVYDYSSAWRSAIELGVNRWEAALASRSIGLTYSPQAPTLCENLAQPQSGITICESTTAYGDERWADGEHQQIWVENGAILVRGRVRIFRDPPSSDFADMLVCHELGHTLQLPHVPDGSDSCMTQPPQRIDPSGWDIANALSFIPDDTGLTIPPREDRDKERKKHKKENGKGKSKRQSEANKDQRRNDENQRENGDDATRAGENRNGDEERAKRASRNDRAKQHRQGKPRSNRASMTEPRSFFSFPRGK